MQYVLYNYTTKVFDPGDGIVSVNYFQSALPDGNSSLRLSHPTSYRLCCLPFPSCSVLKFFDGWQILIDLSGLHLPIQEMITRSGVTDFICFPFGWQIHFTMSKCE